MKETDALTVNQIRQAVKLLRSHKAINQESDLTPDQWNKLRESFNSFMEERFKDTSIENDINELKNMLTVGRLV